MLKINGKNFMNIQEAVQWLLDNNALPFQCNVNYIANTEIAKSAIINPSPAEIKVGALVLFADSKIGTVSGLTSNGFMVGSDYTDIANALAFITAVNVDSYGNLTCTLSDGRIVDAGKIKQVSSFSIDASQHLIVTYNTGVTEDLGAIFNGNITITGNLTVTGSIDGDTLLEKVKDSAGHNRFVEGAGNPLSMTGYTNAYCRYSLSGSHIMFVLAGSFESGVTITSREFAGFTIPQWIADKIFPVFAGSRIEVKEVNMFNDDWSSEGSPLVLVLSKSGNYVSIQNVQTTFTTTKSRGFRVQFDLLIDNA